MYYSSSTSPKDKAMMLKRHKQRKAGELKALAEEREKCAQEIKKMQDEAKQQEVDEARAKVASGEVSTYSAVGLTEEEVLSLCRGDVRGVARKRLLPKAFAVADLAMDHEDPRVALVGAKLAFDAAAPTKEELDQLARDGEAKDTLPDFLRKIREFDGNGEG